jgi:hypothetical protein
MEDVNSAARIELLASNRSHELAPGDRPATLLARQHLVSGLRLPLDMPLIALAVAPLTSDLTAKPCFMDGQDVLATAEEINAHIIDQFVIVDASRFRLVQAANLPFGHTWRSDDVGVVLGHRLPERTMFRWTRIRCGTWVSCPYNTPLIHLPRLRQPYRSPGNIPDSSAFANSF